jgi:hypothetical protein
LSSCVTPVTRVDVRGLFERAYPSFVDVCRAVDEPGVALVAIDEPTSHVAGIAYLRARVDRHVSAIVGRHDHCDLFLDGSDRLALRQLAVVMSPVRSWRAGGSEVSYRLLDLRTADGMVDETERSLRGLRSEGAAVVRCAGYVIYALPLGDATDWPASATDAWAYLPERVYFDELDRMPEGSVVREPVASRSRVTLVRRVAGPRDSVVRLVDGGDVAGHLFVRGPSGQGSIAVGHQALRDGVLLGRYARCDAQRLCDDPALSRVHALVLLVDDRLLAIDVASTNGTREAGKPDARIVELLAGTELELGDSTSARWCWSS